MLEGFIVLAGAFVKQIFSVQNERLPYVIVFGAVPEDVLRGSSGSSAVLASAFITLRQVGSHQAVG